MRNRLKRAMLVALLGVTWVIDVYHIGVYPRPPLARLAEELAAPGPPAWWRDRSRAGIHQLVLEGSPFHRGIEGGHATRDLIYRQEKELNTELARIIPSAVLLRALTLIGMRWFWGIDRYLEPWMSDEIYGVSRSTTHEFDYLADRFTRQIAYHGLHEVGQLMVDQGGEDMGCTVVALPFQGSWVLGRNFDFEGGRIFDTEKVVKWIFPDRGHALVSVIWAGMVGAVTGVNDQGIYLSLNAAGSTDFRRQGTPSTLVLLKALQEAGSAREAIRILRDSSMFITDIFVLLDSRTGELYRIEKSPRHTEVIPLAGPSVVTNHLISPRWRDDPINRYRRDELTSVTRSRRAEELLKALPPARDAREAERQVLGILRDKGEWNGRPLPIGDRRAIDALIATHSVVFNASSRILYVSRGPGLAGEFLGYDLRRSFAAHRPVRAGVLPRDPLVSDELFEKVKLSDRDVSAARRALRRGRCVETRALLDEARGLYTGEAAYYTAEGDYRWRCRADREGARAEWREAQAHVPAYPRELRGLEARLSAGEWKP